jgi:flagellar basal-body rod modification protein FlgD
MTSILANPNSIGRPKFETPAQISKENPEVLSSVASTSTTAGAGTITSSDFLTLLVTELKNQDPTSDQDPNAYIDQLVQVNSLQQLISINQDLSGSTSATAAISSKSDKVH